MKKAKSQLYILILVALSVLTVLWIFSNNFASPDRSYDEAASHIFSVNNSEYYAFDVNSKEVVSGIDAADLINSVLADNDGLFQFTEGTYTISSSLILDSGDWLVGMDYLSGLHLSDFSDCPVIYSKNTCNVSVSNLFIKGNKAGQSGGVGLSGVRFENVSDFVLCDLVVENTFHQGLDLVAFSSNGVIRDIQTFRTGASGIYIGYQCFDLTVERAVLKESGAGVGGSNIDSDGLIVAGEDGYCNNITLFDITAIDCMRHGLSFWDSENISGTNILAVGNSGNGILFSRGNHYVELNNVQAKNNSLIGIAVFSGNQEFEGDNANHNISIQGVAAGNLEEGVKVGGCPDGNYVKLPYSVCISVDCVENGYSGIGIAGINGTLQVSKVFIENCTVKDNSVSNSGDHNGILLYQATSVKVDNVSVSGSSHAWGIYESTETGGDNVLFEVNVESGCQGDISFRSLTSNSVI